MHMLANLKAFIFDLDGTIVDSKLNFDQMRADLGFPDKAPILEHLETLRNQKEIEISNKIIHDHEMAGLAASELIAGYLELHNFLKQKKIKLGLLTRNSSLITKLTLEKYDLSFDFVLTRDDCAAKPDPEGLLIMQKSWGLNSKEMIYIGDFSIDIETAKSADMYAGLYHWPYNQQQASRCDINILAYSEFQKKLSKLLN